MKERVALGKLGINKSARCPIVLGGRYTLYLDETGDRGLLRFDPGYPVLGLCAVIVDELEYRDEVAPAVEALKRTWFGTADLTLHYSAVMKKSGPYAIFKDKGRLFAFEQDIADLIARLPLTVLATIINKSEYTLEAAARPALDPTWPTDLYHVAVDFVLERFVEFLEQRGGTGSALVAEARSPRKAGEGREDRLLRAHYEGRLDVPTRFFTRERFAAVLPPTVDFRTKSDRVAGLELADLLAPQIATRTLRQIDDRLLIWQAVRSKFWVRGDGRPGGLGLKTFPVSQTAREIMDVPLQPAP